MRPLRVWAPDAARVELEHGGRRRPLEREDDGWWTLGASLAAGEDYAFVVDGSGPLPDPRSRWQPAGVDGPSRVDDPASFRWTDAGWSPPALEDGVIYEMHVGTFTPGGTFDAAIGKLEHLLDLGVTHLELLPVNQFSGRRGWGYDGVGLFAPHHAYGGPAGLRRLVDACHARGIAVLMDVVYNHLGPEGNHLPRFGPYFTFAHPTPWGPAMNLDGPGSHEVRRFFLDNAAMWMRDFHIDGLRADAVHALHDDSPEHLLSALARETADLSRALGRRLVLIAETNRHDPRTVSPRPAGHGFDAQWCDDPHHALHSVLTGERGGYYAPYGRLSQVAGSFARGFIDHPPAPAPAHAAPAHASAFPPAGGHRFLGYLQDHDQVGNRAHGERISHLIGPDLTRAAATLVLCAPFVPMLFQGEEWGASTPWLFFCDHQGEWLHDAVREGRWREFGEPLGLAVADLADPMAPDSMTRSVLRWDERVLPEHAAYLTWYRSLLHLRRDRPDLRDGDLASTRALFDESARWLVLARARTAILLNLAPAAQSVPLPELPGAPRVLLSSGDGAGIEGGSAVVPAHAAVVVGV